MEQNERESLLQKFADANRKLALVTEQLEIANKKTEGIRRESTERRECQ